MRNLNLTVSKIANKRRPKQYRPPYRRYVYKSDFTGAANSSDEESDSEEQLLEQVKDQNYKDFQKKTNLNISSVYILTTQHKYKGKVWPMSQFEKVDVLKCCLNKGNEAYNEAIQVINQQAIEQQNWMTFPVEIIVNILKVLYYRGQLKPKFLRLNKMFYNIVLPMIYGYPELKATNFFAFVDTVSSNKKVGQYIKRLDLSMVIQSGKNSFVAKLLKRSKKGLEAFVAPQTSFGLAPLVSLKNCENLRILDLRLVSETLNLAELFNSIRNLDKLTKLSFPRSSIEMDPQLVDQIHWPPKLSSLRISGGISDEFLVRSTLPNTITHLEFAHCPQIHDEGIKSLLYKFGKNLKVLKVEYPMPKLKENTLDIVFDYCPNLIVLLVYVDYVSGAFFDEYNLRYLEYERPLKTLYIDSSGMLGTSTKLNPLDLTMALVDRRLPHLQNIRCTAKLGWDPKSDLVSTIIEELEDRDGGFYLGY